MVLAMGCNRYRLAALPLPVPATIKVVRLTQPQSGVVTSRYPTAIAYQNMDKTHPAYFPALSAFNVASKISSQLHHQQQTLL